MALYIKVNSKVAEYLGLERQRYKLLDGNYLLWQMDMAVFGPLSMIRESAKKIGGLVLSPADAKSEQQGNLRALPEPEDTRFAMPKEVVKSEDPGQIDEATEDKSVDKGQSDDTTGESEDESEKTSDDVTEEETEAETEESGDETYESVTEAEAEEKGGEV